MAGQLKQHWHGKSRVRVLKTFKQTEQHSVLELTVNIRLWGEYDNVYTKGDNSGLVATDTMKNTVYIVAKTTEFDSIESYALILTDHFLKKYPMLYKVEVVVRGHPWVRASIGGQPHSHGFVRERTDYRVATATRTRDSIQLSAGIRDLVVLKTTQSGFKGFLHDENTSLPDCDDRLLSTSISVDYTFAKAASGADFNAVSARVRDTLLSAFFGPADTGVYSNSVQETMYQMGNKVLSAVAGIDDVVLDMPNIHFLPVRSLANHGLEWTGEVHMPTDEPHGTICATISRSKL